VICSLGLLACALCAQASNASNSQGALEVVAGSWRPVYPFEQVAWIRSPWREKDVLYLDFPEAIFTDRGLIYLSHVNPIFPVLFPDLPRVEWAVIPGGIQFERALPDGVTFGGSVQALDERSVGLSLFIENNSEDPLGDIKLQTCLYLKQTADFGEKTMDNKIVHVPGQGWLPFPEAEKASPNGKYRLGWRMGRPIADKPVVVCRGKNGRNVAMTWGDATYSLIGNPDHPCMHADPAFDDLPPGARAGIEGKIVFFEGDIDQVEQLLK